MRMTFKGEDVEQNRDKVSNLSLAAMMLDDRGTELYVEYYDRLCESIFSRNFSQTDEILSEMKARLQELDSITFWFNEHDHEKFLRMLETV